MAGPGRIPGRYNLIIEESYDAFDHQMPVDEFISRLKNNNIPDEVSVIGLEDAFEDDDLATELAREMDQRANDLEYQNPTVQFVVEGSSIVVGKPTIRHDDELYSLQDVFGPQLQRKEQGEWLVAPF